MRKYLLPDDIRKLSLEEMIQIQKEENKPQPLYPAEKTQCISTITYSWSGRTKDNTNFPSTTPEIIEQCRDHWEQSGINLLTSKQRENTILAAFEVTPEISPVDFCRKIKGLLSRQFRVNGVNVNFSRSVSFRSLGHNTTEIVNQYVKNQILKEDLADENFREQLKKYTLWDCQRDLSWASSTHYGLYWYNLHLVIVVAARNIRIAEYETFDKIKSVLPRIADKNGCEIAHFAVVPDHIHISLAGNPKMTPFEIGLSFLNNLAYSMKVGKCWREDFYVGTFSEYDLEALKNKININPPG